MLQVVWVGVMRLYLTAISLASFAIFLAMPTTLAEVLTTTEVVETSASKKESPTSNAPATSTNDFPGKIEAETDLLKLENEQKESDESLRQRQQQFIAADRLYLAGEVVAAARLYRQLKTPFTAELKGKVETRSQPYYDTEQLPPKGRVYWRIATKGREQGLRTKTIVPLQFLVAEYPEFIRGHLRYAEVLKEEGKNAEALEVLEKAAATYEDQPELLRATITTLAEQKQWLEASLLARQFALTYSEVPEAEEFSQLASQHLKNYKRHLRSEITGNAIASILTGAISYAVTGGLAGPVSALETSALLLQGEESLGQQFSQRFQKQLPMLEDPEVLAYVREIGNKLVSYTGRNEFNYQFYVVRDEKLNAFALPGGKIFINAGALVKTESEAELAGLLAHELSHAVLSHGFQLVAEGTKTSNVLQMIPYAGGVASNLITLGYSRDMERQADILGTKILVASGYAADGLRNLMVTLEAENKSHNYGWFSSHPDTEKRINYLENLIVTQGYDRYAYEGVSKHSQIQEKVANLLADYQEKEKRHPR